MSKLSLQAKKRTIFKKKIKRLRKENLLPGILYGRKIENLSLSVNLLEFRKIFKQIGESSVLDLQIEGEKTPRKVIIQDVQFDPLNENYLHVDFHQIDLTKELETKIPFEFVGESPAVKHKKGTLIKHLNEIKIRCLPQDLPSKIEVDITSLEDFHQSISVKDLSLPPRIKLLEKEDEVVVSVVSPRIEKEEEKKKETEEEAGEKEIQENKAEENKDNK